MKYIPGKIEQYDGISEGYTSGYMLTSANGKDYIGHYVSIKGNFYAGKLSDLIDKNGKILKNDAPKLSIRENRVSDKILKHRFGNNAVNIISYSCSPTKRDYDKGYVTRYFIQKKNDKPHILEVDKTTYIKVTTQAAAICLLYNSLKIKWIITGKETDECFNGLVATKSVANQNKETVLDANKIMSGIKKILFDYIKYALFIK